MNSFRCQVAAKAVHVHVALSSPGRRRATERSVAHPDCWSWAISRERGNLLRHPLPGRDATESVGGEQVQRRRFGLFRLKKDARCSSLLQPVHAREEQRAPKSTPLVGRARPGHPDFPDGIFSVAVGHLVEFTETKRRSARDRSGQSHRWSSTPSRVTIAYSAS